MSASNGYNEPTAIYLTSYLSLLTFVSLVSLAYINTLSNRGLRAALQELGVALSKCARAAREVERKTFHLAGLLVPLIYQLMLQWNYTKQQCVTLVWCLAIVGVTVDLMRVYIPFVNRNMPGQGILREEERNKLTASCYFAVGCASTITIFSPPIAMASIEMLVLGDMSAAFVGVCFGGDTCVVRVGPGAKKSVEGSLAMFIVCFVVGCSVFAEIHLREYAVFWGALAATLTELYEPFGLDDNLTIPLASGLALVWGFERLSS